MKNVFKLSGVDYPQDYITQLDSVPQLTTVHPGDNAVNLKLKHLGVNLRLYLGEGVKTSDGQYVRALAGEFQLPGPAAPCRLDTASGGKTTATNTLPIGSTPKLRINSGNINFKDNYRFPISVRKTQTLIRFSVLTPSDNSIGPEDAFDVLKLELSYPGVIPNFCYTQEILSRGSGRVIRAELICRPYKKETIVKTICRNSADLPPGFKCNVRSERLLSPVSRVGDFVLPLKYYGAHVGVDGCDGRRLSWIYYDFSPKEYLRLDLLVDRNIKDYQGNGFREYVMRSKRNEKAVYSFAMSSGGPADYRDYFYVNVKSHPDSFLVKLTGYKFAGQEIVYQSAVSKLHTLEGPIEISDSQVVPLTYSPSWDPKPGEAHVPPSGFEEKKGDKQFYLTRGRC